MRRLMVGAGSLVLGALLLTGCGGQAGDASIPADTAAAPVSEGVPQEALPAAAAPSRQVITTAWVSLRVESVPRAADEVEGLITRAGGTIQQQDLSSSGGTTTATITARVPSSSLDRFLDEVGALGTVETSSRQAADVTQQTIDLDARIGALTTSVERLQELLAQTENVADLVAVETELANRRAELDSLVAQRTYLADQVSMSTATITLSPVVEVGGWQAPGFLSGVQNGWNALIGLAGALITAAGFLLPFAIVGAVIVVPIVWLLVRRARRPRG